MKTISLNVSIEEANLILEALGNLPFTRVYALIGKIQEQAAQQLNSSDGVLTGGGAAPKAED
jgi:hypothetical protein